MESLSYAYEGTGLFSTDDADLRNDGLVTSRNLLQKWDGVDSMGFDNRFMENSGDDTNDNSGKSVVSNSTITLNSSVEFSTIYSVSANKGGNSAAPRESNGKRISIGNSALASAKRARVTNFQSQIPSCIVYGCNKDLSSAKDYHKRHKVCDVHSKASLVVVNGIQQRFCQQCSRFHVLAEFDEGKRSCRKRLAGHNERRRKPQFDAHFGSTFYRTDLSSKTSLFFSKFLPGGFFGPQCNEPTNHIMNIKLEEKPSQVSQLPMKFLQNRCPPRNCLETPLSGQDLSSGSNSSCALSLLSAESHNLLTNSAGVSMAPPLISIENSLSDLRTDQNSSNNLITPSIAFVPENGLPQESNGLNLKRYLSHESVNTVDLHELSLHLQRVEQQKYNARVKLENGNVRHSTTT
ncbi:hypothetical protein BUALT_Bualt05G0140900 [Buddleja alternifolia]|uniref:SBP-type domain-containing protein n=1 Tax=Buddleja alternifolia TaxID=168488 RepID=A0AAV6XL30_9LAMI|nr:hypothetical protein BUALT_Bualt05G0140900 [Buddleja alternifolia]